ncbi:unnamed protein product [Psylliodes chrysocephalus]|uniref:cystathionine beta-synthase n=1 Tax=Psylliodes chrysocephalus TaxID=3402493 RepID=A0A9P0G437_9CUCU|nr:unnamed protein product [Psylliodes chrysocephala]
MFVFKSSLEESLCLPNRVSKCKWSKDSKNQVPSCHSKWDWKHESKKILPDILSAVGNTPMVKLNKIPKAEGIECEIYGKCEFLNPAGSIKDRISRRCIEDAENNGSLKPGGTVIEISSGNTGASIAWTCAIKGYRCIIILPDKFSKEKESIIRALGADVVRVPLANPPDSPEGMFGKAHILYNQIPNSVIIDQFSNPANPLMHYDTTAEEIFDQCDGQIDMIVLGCGTGGTLGGISRKFKEISPQTLIIGADPYGSTYAQPDSLNETDVKFIEIEGIGYSELLPPVCDRSMVHKWYKFHDKEALTMARRLIKEEGLLIGTTSGLLVACAVKAIKEFKLGKGKKVVVLLPDGTKNYLSKFVQDQWMEQRGFMPCINTKNLWWWDIKVTDLECKPTINVTISQSLDEVLTIMEKNSMNYLPVLEETGHVIGVAIRRNIENKLISSESSRTDQIVTCLDRMYSKLPKCSNLGLVSRALEVENYVLVLDSQGELDTPFCLLTSEDVLRITRAKKSP